MITITNGSLTNSNEQYIVHQCNCVSITSYGLSSTLFKEYPYADCYSNRRQIGKRNLAIAEDRSLPGSIMVCGNGSDKRYVINLFGQYGMGKAGSPYIPFDTCEQRKLWFQKGLDEIDKLKPLSIAFPYKIGCGLGGGNWNDYFSMIENFAKLNPSTNIVLYQI